VLLLALVHPIRLLFRLAVMLPMSIIVDNGPKYQDFRESSKLVRHAVDLEDFTVCFETID